MPPAAGGGLALSRLASPRGVTAVCSTGRRKGGLEPGSAEAKEGLYVSLPPRRFLNTSNIPLSFHSEPLLLAAPPSPAAASSPSRSECSWKLLSVGGFVRGDKRRRVKCNESCVASAASWQGPAPRYKPCSSSGSCACSAAMPPAEGGREQGLCRQLSPRLCLVLLGSESRQVLWQSCTMNALPGL